MGNGMATRMGFVALACVLSVTAACHRFATSPEDRINAAMPLAADTAEAKRAFDTLARAQSYDAARIDNEFRDRLKMRALECAHGYSPAWSEGEESVRAQLSDTACFERFDQSLAQWVGLRHAGLLLAAPPLRPIPAKPAPYLVAEDRIAEGSFARQAGIAVLHTSKRHEVFDLGSGQRLQAILRNGRSFVVDISDNGRLLSLNQDQATVVVDLERGKPLLRLEDVGGQKLFWVGKAGAVYVPENARAPLFLDLLSGRESPLPTSIGSLGAVAPTPAPGRYALLGFTRHASIDVVQDAQGWSAKLAQEVEPNEAVGNWRPGNLNADGTLYIGQQNGLALLDLLTLQARKVDLKPLMVSAVVPTPDPDLVYLAGTYRTATGFEHEPLLYSLSKRTLAAAQVAKRLYVTLVYLPSIKRNAVRDDFKLSLLDELHGAAPVDAQTYLQGLPVAEPAPMPAIASDEGAAAAARAAWLAETARGSRTAATDPALAMRATMADIEAVGIYEGEGAVHGPGSSARQPGTVQVRVKRGRPVILVLTSYEPVNWIVKPDPGAIVLAVLRGGYYPSQVQGAGNARITDLGRLYAYKRGDAAYEKLDAEVKRLSGKPMDRFQGTYRGQAFEVGGRN